MFPLTAGTLPLSIGGSRLLLAGLLLETTASIAASSSDSRRQQGDCSGRGPKLEVQVLGIAKMNGTLRVQAYSSANDYLKKGRWMARVEVPVRSRASSVCINLPSPGRYAIAVRHDANGNGRSDWNDGAGFSKNPRLSLLSQPTFDDTAIPVVSGMNRTSIYMNYRRGLSITRFGAPVR